MPYPNQHAARIKSPEAFEEGSFRTKKITEGVSIIVGKLKGETKTTAQAYRFEKSKFTAAEAKKWLKENKVKTMSFEPAKKEEDQDDLDIEDIDINTDDQMIHHFDVFDNTKLFLTDKYTITPEGFLKTQGIVTNTGIFRYLKSDGSIINELREPSEVFNDQSLNTLKNIPITDYHPQELVTADNIKEMQKKGIIIGFTGSKVMNDGHAVSIDVTITDKDKIEKIKSGEQRAFSCGYKARLDFSKTGNAFGNNRYDAVQRDIMYNHVALVDRGRAGDLAQINMDSFITDNTVIQIIEKEEGDHMPEKLQTINIDGIDYQIEKDVFKHINSLQSKIDTLNKDNSDLSGKKDAFENEVKDLKEKLENSKKSDEEIQKAVIERLELQKIADHFKIQYDENKSNKDLKLAIIKAKNDKVDLTDKDDNYVNAYFDSIVDITKADIENEIKNKNKAKVTSDYVDNKKDQPITKEQLRDSWTEQIIRDSQNYSGSASIQDGKIKLN